MTSKTLCRNLSRVYLSDYGFTTLRRHFMLARSLELSRAAPFVNMSVALPSALYSKRV